MFGGKGGELEPCTGAGFIPLGGWAAVILNIVEAPEPTEAGLGP